MKHIFFDIDGTLIDCLRGMKEPSIKTKLAIKQLKGKHKTYIASGRAMFMLQDDIINLNTDGFLLNNGAYLKLDDKELLSIGMDEEIVNKVIDYCLNNNGVFYEETSDTCFTNGLNKSLHHKYMSEFDGEGFKAFDYKLRNNKKVNMFIVIFENMEAALKFKSEFSDLLNITFQFPNYPYLDVNIKGINKAYGLKYYCETNNIKREDVIFFGDSYNDIEMIKYAGLGIAMNNGVKELKESADYITDDVLNDGVYKALLKYNLIEEIQEV